MFGLTEVHPPDEDTHAWVVAQEKKKEEGKRGAVSATEVLKKSDAWRQAFLKAIFNKSYWSKSLPWVAYFLTDGVTWTAICSPYVDRSKRGRFRRSQGPQDVKMTSPASIGDEEVDMGPSRPPTGRPPGSSSGSIGSSRPEKRERLLRNGPTAEIVALVVLPVSLLLPLYVSTCILILLVDCQVPSGKLPLYEAGEYGRRCC